MWTSASADDVAIERGNGKIGVAYEASLVAESMALLLDAEKGLRRVTNVGFVGVVWHVNLESGGKTKLNPVDRCRNTGNSPALDLESISSREQEETIRGRRSMLERRRSRIDCDQVLQAFEFRHTEIGRRRNCARGECNAIE